MKKVIFFNSNYNLKDKVNKAFNSIYGLNKEQTEKLFKSLGLKKKIDFNSLEKESLKESFLLLDSLPFKTNIKLKIFLDDSLQKLIKIKAYRGLRRKQGFPVRGQRTHTNAKTSKKFK